MTSDMEPYALTVGDKVKMLAPFASFWTVEVQHVYADGTYHVYYPHMNQFYILNDSQIAWGYTGATK